MLLVQPLADRLVARLARTPVAPWHVVALHTLVGFAAALLVSSPAPAAWLWAALLLQVKTVLDNVDGGLARATGRVTEFGRYFDTVSDLLVNAALFWALARHGPWLGTLAGFLSLTLALSGDFNAERLHRQAHSGRAGDAQADRQAPSVPAGAWPWALTLVRGFYRAVLAPQDRALEAADRRLFRLAAGKPWAEAGPVERRRWSDVFSTGALVNLGLSTQYLALGVALWLGMPYAWVVLAWLLVPYLLVVQALRVTRFRRAGVAP